MKLACITVMVRDLERSEQFYWQFAGLQAVRRLEPAGGRIVFLADGAGDTALELVELPGAEPAAVRGLTLSFRVTSDLEALRERLERAGYVPAPIVDRPPKPRHFTVPDPDGLPVEFSV